MNAKKVKTMRKVAKGCIAINNMNPSLFKHVYKAIKKGVRNEAKLGRLNVTTTKPMERAYNVSESKGEHLDTHN